MSTFVVDLPIFDNIGEINPLNGNDYYRLITYINKNYEGCKLKHISAGYKAIINKVDDFGDSYSYGTDTISSIKINHTVNLTNIIEGYIVLEEITIKDKMELLDQ